VSKTFGEWYQKTNKTEDANKLTLLAFKIIIILHNTRLATFIKLLETVSKGLGLPPYGSTEYSPSLAECLRFEANANNKCWNINSWVVFGKNTA
jgi:hypothetical protein